MAYPFSLTQQHAHHQTYSQFQQASGFMGYRVLHSETPNPNLHHRHIRLSALAPNRRVCSEILPSRHQESPDFTGIEVHL